MFAQELAEGLQAHGFVSQSVVHTSDNNVGGNSDDSLAWGLREMGANLSWRPTPDWLISGQALARWAGESDKGELRLDYGFVDRTLIADGDTQVGIRIGKIKNPYGFFNTTRDVAHTRPGIIMPQSIYLDRIRNFILSAPGVSLYGNHAGADMDVTWSIGAVKADGDDPDLESLFLIADRVGTLKGDTTWLCQVMTETQGGRWRLGLTLGDVRMHYQPHGDPILQGGHNRLTPFVISVEHNTERFSLTGEFSQTRHKSENYGSHPLALGIQQPNTVEGWYLQGTYRPALDWQIYLRHDEIYLDNKNKKGLNAPFPPSGMFAKDWTVGVRYDLNNWAYSAEYHKVNGTAWVSTLDTPFSDQKRDWEMLLLQAAWRF